MRFTLTVAWRNLWRQKRRSLITSVAMAVGMSLCMATTCFQDGMFAELFEVMVEQQLGHIQVHHPDYPSRRNLHDTVHGSDALVAAVRATEGVAAVSAKLSGFVLLGGREKSSGAALVGIDPSQERLVGPLEDRIVAGRYLSEEAKGEILIGKFLADDLEVGLDAELVAVTQASDGSLGNELYRVVGIFRTGNAQMDRAGGYIHVAEARRLLVLPDQAHQITVLATDPGAIEPLVARLVEARSGDGLEILPWWLASPQTAQMMGMRDASAVIVLGVVFAAAAFGILNTMMMSVFERTRELGVLKALGLSPLRMVSLVVVESLLLAALSAAIGLALGAVLDTFVVRVGFDMSSAAADGFSFAGVMLDPVIRGVVRWQPIVAVVVSVFLVSGLASLWPAIRAARLSPVEAIRTE